ncbi:MAG: hypothetical protein AB1679_28965 [Actinomycetota bacterium]
MPSKPPRFLPTLALAALWLVLYFLWVAIRPAAETTATQTRGRTTPTSSTTTTTGPPLFKLKP